MRRVIDVRVAPNGRMFLPRSVRQMLGLTSSGVVMLSIKGDDVKLTSLHQGVKRARF